MDRRQKHCSFHSPVRQSTGPVEADETIYSPLVDSGRGDSLREQGQLLAKSRASPLMYLRSWSSFAISNAREERILARSMVNNNNGTAIRRNGQGNWCNVDHQRQWRVGRPSLAVRPSIRGSTRHSAAFHALQPASRHPGARSSSSTATDESIPRTPRQQ